MNLLYLSPHYPPHFSQFVISLANHGVKVFGISDYPEEALDPALKDALAGHYRVPKLEDIDKVMEGCHLLKDNFGQIDRVESHLEPWTELEAMIREEFDIFGPKPEELKYLKRKSLMKDIFKKAKLPVAKGAIVKDMNQCEKFIGKQYPVFIKPDIGVGAADTYTIKTKEDLEAFFGGKQEYDYFMEEYVDGDIESFDGLTDTDGNIVFYTSHKFSNDIHNVVKNNENVWYYSVRDIPADLEKNGRAVVQAANIREKFFHIEFFRLANGKLKALEINLRPPGGLTTDMFNYACDVDVYDWWASMIAGKESKKDFTRKYHCAFIGRKNDRKYTMSHDDLYVKWGDQMVHSQPMSPIEYTVMGQWGYLARAESEAEMMEIINDIIREA